MNNCSNPEGHHYIIGGMCEFCGKEMEDFSDLLPSSFRQLGFNVYGFIVESTPKKKPAFIMPTCPESGKPVNQCRCDKCPIPF